MKRIGDELLGPRAANRATLARPGLLERVSMPALDAVEHLAGMQAQAPHSRTSVCEPGCATSMHAS